jgi:hypothetical protein
MFQEFAEQVISIRTGDKAILQMTGIEQIQVWFHPDPVPDCRNAPTAAFGTTISIRFLILEGEWRE